MQKKQGITLVILCITILVLAILTTVTIVNFESIAPSAKKEKIAEEFEYIESKIKEYYLTYGNYPIANNTTYTKAELIELQEEDKKKSLVSDITKNGDEDSIFYLVDLQKIGVMKSTFGLNSEPTDIYIASSKTGMLYYLKGVSIEGRFIFSTRAFDETYNIE